MTPPYGYDSRISALFGSETRMAHSEPFSPSQPSWTPSEPYSATLNASSDAAACGAATTASENDPWGLIEAGFIDIDMAVPFVCLYPAIACLRRRTPHPHRLVS